MAPPSIQHPGVPDGTSHRSSSPGEGSDSNMSSSSTSSTKQKRYSYSDEHYIYDVIEEEILEQAEEVMEQELVDDDGSASYEEEVIKENDDDDNLKKKPGPSSTDASTQASTSDDDEASSSLASTTSAPSFPFDEVILTESTQRDVRDSVDLYWAMQCATDAFLTADLDVLYSSKPGSPPKEDVTIHDSWRAWQYVAPVPPKGISPTKKKTVAKKQKQKGTKLKGVDIQSEREQQINVTTNKVMVTTGEMSSPASSSDNQEWMQQWVEKGLSPPSPPPPPPPPPPTTTTTTTRASTASKTLPTSILRASSYPAPRDIESQTPQTPRVYHHNPLLKKFFDEPPDLINPAKTVLDRDSKNKQRKEESEDAQAIDSDRRIAGAIVLFLLLVLPLLAMGIVLIVQREEDQHNSGSEDFIIPMIPIEDTSIMSTTRNATGISSRDINNIFSAEGQNMTGSTYSLP